MKSEDLKCNMTNRVDMLCCVIKIFKRVNLNVLMKLYILFYIKFMFVYNTYINTHIIMMYASNILQFYWAVMSQ